MLTQEREALETTELAVAEADYLILDRLSAWRSSWLFWKISPREPFSWNASAGRSCASLAVWSRATETSASGLPALP